MSTEDPPKINVDISALDDSRVYQVAEGNMFIGDVDPVTTAARRLAAMPVQQSVEQLLSMPSDERSSVLAEMPASAAAPRISSLPELAAIQVLTEIDEQLAIERLLLMHAPTARGLVLAAPDPSRSNLLEAMSLEQTAGFLGEFDANSGSVSLSPEVLRDFAQHLPLAVICSILAAVSPEVGAHVLEAAPDRDIVIWLAMEEAARLTLTRHMQITLLDKAIYAASNPSDEVYQLCSMAGRSLPTLGEIIGCLTWERLAELVDKSDWGIGIYSALPPEVHVTLMKYMQVDGLARAFSKMETQALASCITGMMTADQSAPFRPPLACRYIAVALATSPVEPNDVLQRLPQQYAHALGGSHWAYGVANEISKADTSSPYSESTRNAYAVFAGVPESHRQEVAWHLPSGFATGLVDYLSSRRWKNSKQERDLKILEEVSRVRRYPDSLA